MQRPYIICHMVMSVDGKVTGDFLFRPETQRATELYYEINRYLKCNGFICGRITMEGSFTEGWYPDLCEYSPVESAGTDFIPENEALTGFYAVAFDPKGRLGWKSRLIEDPDGDPGYDGAQIIEVLTEEADKRYLGYLKEMKIPYIFAGKSEIDVELALTKLKSLFGADRLLLEGGSVVNGYFQRAGVIDELSLVICPVIADSESKPLFFGSVIDNFELSDIRNHGNGVLRTMYKKVR